MSLNIDETFALLFDKNNNTAYKALQNLQKESQETDGVYPYMDRLSDMLDSDNSYIRTRGLTLNTGDYTEIIKTAKTTASTGDVIIPMETAM